MRNASLATCRSVATLLTVLLVAARFDTVRSWNSDYQLIVLDKECNLCLKAVGEHERLELATCDEDDSRQLWNWDDICDDKFVLKKTYNGHRYCIQYDNSNRVTLEECDEGDNKKEFTYDKGPHNSISPKDNDDNNLCMTYKNDAKDGEEVRLKKCSNLSDARREWVFVDPDDYDSDDCNKCNNCHSNFQLIVLDKECNLCLSAVGQDEELELARCDEDDSRQLWNWDDICDDQFVLKKTYNGHRYCIQYDSNDHVFLEKCDGGENKQEFTYDKTCPKTISPKDNNDDHLCITYKDDAEVGEEVRLKKCIYLSDARREWVFVDTEDYDSDDCYPSLDFKLLLLKDDDGLCACVGEARLGETVRLCDCIEDNENSIDSQRQQWRLSKSSGKQLWRPRRNSNLCACPDANTIKLFECSSNQAAFWTYDDEYDNLLCHWQTEDEWCVSINRDGGGRRELLGFGRDVDKGTATGGGGITFGFGNRAGHNGPKNPSNFHSVADPLVLNKRDRADQFELVEVSKYSRPSGYPENDYELYRLDDGNLCIGYDMREVGQYLKVVDCRTGDKSQQWKLVNEEYKWQNRLLEDAENSGTRLCVREDDSHYLRLAYCDDVDDEWTYGDHLKKAIARAGSPRKCVTFFPDKYTRDLRAGFGIRGGSSQGYYGYGYNGYPLSSSDSADEDDPLRLFVGDCGVLDPEHYRWHMDEPDNY